MKLCRYCQWVVGAAILGLIVLTFNGCASTKLASTWKAPDYAEEPLRQVAVFVLSEDENIRRFAEDQMARSFPEDARAVASYTFVPESERGDREKIRARLVKDGFDGALVTRLITVDNKATYVPPTYVSPAPHYSSFHGYYGHGWRETYRPGYVEINTIVTIETVLYALGRKKLIWAGTSETFDPESTREVVEGVVSVVTDELKAQGLVGSRPE